MIRWPWTSRARIDDAHDEIEFLRLQVKDLQDKIDRRERFKLGMSEAPRPEKQVLGPMPAALQKYIMEWGSTDTRRAAIKQATARAQQDGSWDPIMAEALNDSPEQARAIGE